MRGFEAIADQVARLGVRDVFTFTAKDICELVSELTARGVKVHHTRHEHVAVGMADGYSRASGRVGVAIVGQGVGLTNALNALLTAAKAYSRVVVLVGEVPGAGTHLGTIQRKHVDQPGLLDVLNVRHVDLGSPETAAADIRACFELAEHGGDPVVVNLPDELLQGEVGEAPSRIHIDTPKDLSLSADDKATILELLEASWVSGRTVVLAGRGAVRSGAREALERLAEATGALLGTTVVAKGYFAGSPYSIGVVGTFSTPVASELLQTADLVLAFGASLNYDTTYDSTIFGKARIIHIDNRSAAFGKFQPVDLAVAADARLAAGALADELERRGHHVEGYRTRDTADRIAAFRIQDTFTDRSGPQGLDLRTLMSELDKRLPANRTIVVDGGHFMSYPIHYISVPDPAGFQWPLEYGAIGCGLGNALGSAVALPDRLTVLVIGDGGLMMTLADLDTAARYRLPLLVVVCDNSGLVAEVNYLVEKGYSGDDARYENPSFEAVARSLGFEAATIRELADLDVLTDRLPSLRGPMLLDCKVLTERLLPKVASFARERARVQDRKQRAASPASV